MLLFFFFVHLYTNGYLDYFQLKNLHLNIFSEETEIKDAIRKTQLSNKEEKWTHNGNKVHLIDSHYCRDYRKLSILTIN